MALSVIVNPAAHGGRAGHQVPKIRARLTQAGVDAEVHVPQSRDHLCHLAVQLGDHPDHTLGVVGGDGTNMAIVDALLKHHDEGPLPKLGLIPAGRGNSLSKDLDFSGVDQAIAALSSGKTRDVDVARFVSRGATGHFLNCLGLGFVTEVDQTASHFRYLGDLSYILGVFHRTFMLRHHNYRLEVDDQVIEEPMCFIEVMNSRKTGGEMLMAPEALIDDGLLDIVWVSKINRRQLLGTFPKLFKGTHGENPAVHFLRGKKVTITSSDDQGLLPDGDQLGSTPVTIEVLPGRARYLC
jgi:YegS/Rv2252/BmrU family lipid kinase